MFNFTLHTLQCKLKRAILNDDMSRAWDIMRQIKYMNINTNVKYVKISFTTH